MITNLNNQLSLSKTEVNNQVNRNAQQLEERKLKYQEFVRTIENHRQLIVEYEKRIEKLHASNEEIKMTKTNFEEKLNQQSEQSYEAHQKLQQYEQQVRDDAQKISQMSHELTTMRENHGIELRAQNEVLTKNEVTVLEFQTKVEELNATIAELSTKLNESVSIQATVETKLAEQHEKYDELQQRFELAVQLNDNNKTRASSFQRNINPGSFFGRLNVNTLNKSQAIEPIESDESNESEKINRAFRLAQLNVCLV